MGICGMLILAVWLLSGCQYSIQSGTTPTPSSHESTTAPTQATTPAFDPPQLFASEQNWEDDRISGLRTGYDRPGLWEAGRNFEVTDFRVYFRMKYHDLPLLCYSTHNSDLVLPLCSKPHCRHDSEGCEAYLGNDSSVCVYQDALYVNVGSALYRVNPDGTERTLVVDVLENWEKGIPEILEPRLWNGVFTFRVRDTASEAGTTQYYYTLDGRMSQPRQMEPVKLLHNDGKAFLAQGTGETGGEKLLYQWNPGRNELQLLLDTGKLPEDSPAYGETDFTNGYWGRKAAYFLRESILYRLDYQTGESEALFDTGLTGDSFLSCFQNCIVLSQTGETCCLYLYDWAFHPLGSVELPEAGKLPPEAWICGESRDRIYLAAQEPGVPVSYLDQYYFGYREIEPVALVYPW